jgi:hypothetical protein
MSIDSNNRFATVEEFWQALQAGLSDQAEAGEDVQLMISPESLSSSSLAEDDLLLLASIEEENASGAEQVISTGVLQDSDAQSETGDATIIARRDSLASATPVLIPLEQPSLRVVRVPTLSSRRRSLIIGLVALILLASTGIAVAFWSSTAPGTYEVANRSATFTPRVTQSALPTATRSALIPTVTVVTSPVTTPNIAYLAGTYQGSLTDSVTSQTSHMVVVIQQIRGHAAFDGQISLNLLLEGNNAVFTGVVDINNHFSFITNTSAGKKPLNFYGVVQSGGYLHGNFCNSSTTHCDQDTGYFTVGPRY